MNLVQTLKLLLSILLAYSLHSQVAKRIVLLVYLVAYVQDLLSASLTPNFEYDKAAHIFTFQVS